MKEQMKRQEPISYGYSYFGSVGVESSLTAFSLTG